MSIRWDKAKIVNIQRSGRVLEVGKSNIYGWYVLIECGPYLRYRYHHLPGRPIAEARQMAWKDAGIACEVEGV